MFVRRIISILIIAVGVGMFTYGNNVSKQADQGQEKIEQAQDSQGQRRPVLGPVRRNAQQQATQQARTKIATEQTKVAILGIDATWFRGAGIVVAVLGLGIFAFSFRRR